MASVEDASITSLIERLISSRNRDLSMLLPSVLRIPNSNSGRDTQNPDQESQDPQNPPDRIILVNPFTQGMIVIEGGNLDALLRDLLSKSGRPPATKTSIEAMPEVEVRGSEECAICLEDWGDDQVVLAKEMPCKHKFHGGCIDKWLGIHGSCPVCRYEMPVDEQSWGKKRDVNGEDGGNGEDDEGRGRRNEREIWVTFSVGRSSRRGDSSDNSSSSSDDSPSSPNHEA